MTHLSIKELSARNLRYIEDAQLNVMEPYYKFTGLLNRLKIKIDQFSECQAKIKCISACDFSVASLDKTGEDLYESFCGIQKLLDELQKNASDFFDRKTRLSLMLSCLCFRTDEDDEEDEDDEDVPRETQ